MSTYTWTVTNLTAAATGEGYDNVVKGSSWKLESTQNGYTAYLRGSCAFPPPGGSGYVFTPYQDLTQEQVVEWTQTVLGGTAAVALMEAKIDRMISNLQTPSKIGYLYDEPNPPVDPGTLPWGASGSQL